MKQNTQISGELCWLKRAEHPPPWSVPLDVATQSFGVLLNDSIKNSDRDPILDMYVCTSFSWIKPLLPLRINLKSMAMRRIPNNELTVQHSLVLQKLKSAMKWHVLLTKEKTELFKFSVEQERLYRIQPVHKYIFSGNLPWFFLKKEKNVNPFFSVNEIPTQKEPHGTDPQPHRSLSRLLLSTLRTLALLPAYRIPSLQLPIFPPMPLDHLW